MSNSKRKSCCGKVKHPTLLAAQTALKRTVSQHRKSDPIVTGMSAYKCQHCDGWHIGRSRKKGIDWTAVQRYDEALKDRCAAARHHSPSTRAVAAQQHDAAQQNPSMHHFGSFRQGPAAGNSSPE